MSTQPFIKFHQLYPGASVPRKADPTLSESAALRATRYCEPFSAASGFGWYAFPPIDFSLMWEGETVYWKTALDTPWMELEHCAILPGFKDEYWKHSTGRLQRPAPVPFLGRSLEPGHVQIWSGLLITTRPGWSVLIRPLANHARDPRYEVLDGIIETDWWFGPIVTPIRIRKTDEPIRFRKNKPFFQIQPVPKEAYAKSTLTSFDVATGLDALSEEDWKRLDDALTMQQGEHRTTPGAYKREARKRVTERPATGCMVHPEGK